MDAVGLCNTMPYLQALLLSDNRIYGGAPDLGFEEHQTCLPRLHMLHVDGNELEGRFPEWLLGRAELSGREPGEEGFTSGLSSLSVGRNLLANPNSDVGRRQLATLRRACTTLGVDCRGVPPESCSAFGPRYALSIEGNLCVLCPTEAERVILVILVCGALALILGLVVFFAWLVIKYQSYAKRHLTTILIVVNHAQNLAIIGSMQLEWPESLRRLYSALRLDVLPFLHLECFIQADGSEVQDLVFWLLLYSECVLMLVLLNLWWPLRGCARAINWGGGEGGVTIEPHSQRRRSERRSSKSKSKWGVRTDDDDQETISHRIRHQDAPKLRHTKEFWDDFFSVIFSMFFTFALRYSANLIFVARRNPTEMRLLGYVFAALLFLTVLHGGHFLFRRVQRYVHAQVDSEDKLKAQQGVRYLTSRFTKRGKYWQFAIWARQLALFLISIFLDIIYHFRPKEEHRTASFVAAGLVILVLLVFMQRLQAQRPYVFLFQQTLETLLLMCSVMMIAFAIACAKPATDRTQTPPSHISLTLAIWLSSRL